MKRENASLSLASAILKFRRARAGVLPEGLFGEPAWDLLLELYVADANGTRLTARQVGFRSGVSSNVMSRWLLHLSKNDFVVGDGNGDLDDLLTLSGKGMDSVERLMVTAADIYNRVV